MSSTVYASAVMFSSHVKIKIKDKIKIFIAMQHVKVEMIQDSYATETHIRSFVFFHTTLHGVKP